MRAPDAEEPRVRVLDGGLGFPVHEAPRVGAQRHRDQEAAEWFDYNTPTYVECVVETLAEPLANFTIASVNISIVNTTVLLDTAALEADLTRAKMNFNCETLSHCQMKDSSGLDVGWFGADYTFGGFSSGLSDAYAFTPDSTPVVTMIVPESGMPGQSIEIHGRNGSCGGGDGQELVPLRVRFLLPALFGDHHRGLLRVQAVVPQRHA